jgi:FAD:protein FMN transferase
MLGTKHCSARLSRLSVLALLLGAVFLFGADPAGREASQPSLVRHEASASVMGATFTVAAFGEQRGPLASAIKAAFDEVRRIDHFLSNYRAESELSRINQEASGGPVRVSPEMASLLAHCLAYSKQSEGGFDVTVGPLMGTWGFFKGSGRLPSAWDLARAREKIGYQYVALDPDKRTIRFLRDGMKLDPGGIGKGYAVDRMAAVLRQAGIKRAFISAGSSSLYALGAPPDEARGWYVRIRDPKNPEETAAEVYLKNESLSTSGFYEKFFEVDGKIYSHIMDPRTGMPAEGVLTVSVVSEKTIDSEAWSTAYFVNGPEWTRRHKRRAFRVFLCPTGGACGWVGEEGR